MSAQNQTCTPESNYLVKYYIAWSFIQITINGLVLVAMARDWKVLRRKVVYIYVVSCLTTALCVSVVLLYESFNHVYMFESSFVTSAGNRFNHSNIHHDIFIHWYAFRKSLMWGLSLACSINIAFLMYGVGSTSQFIGPNIKKKISKKSENNNGPIYNQKDNSDANANFQRKASMVASMRTKKMKAVILTASSWVTTIAYCIVVASEFNCIDYCHCLPGYYKVLDCQSEENKVPFCSRLWLPMTTSFSLITVVIWIIGFVINFVMLGRTLRKFYHAHAQITPIRRLSSKTSVRTRSPSKKKSSKKVKSKNQNKNQSRESTGSTPQRTLRTKPPLHIAIKLLVALAISQLVCFAPVMTAFVMDAFSMDVPDDVVFAVLSFISSVYVTLLPGFLIKYMPGIQTSIKRLTLICAVENVAISASKVRRLTRVATVSSHVDDQKTKHSETST